MPKLELDFSELDEYDYSKVYDYKDLKENHEEALVLVSEALGHHRVDSDLVRTYLGSIPL